MTKKLENHWPSYLGSLLARCKSHIRCCLHRCGDLVQEQHGDLPPGIFRPPSPNYPQSEHSLISLQPSRQGKINGFALRVLFCFPISMSDSLCNCKRLCGF